MILMTLSSCGVLGHGCTNIGCADGVSLTFRTADGMWSNGAYNLTVTVDEDTHTCALTLPDDFPARGSAAQLPCAPPLGFPGAIFQQVAVCEERRTADAVINSCTPIQDHYTLSAAVLATPAEVTVSVTRDDISLLEQSLALNYVENQPNGEGCEPVCRGAVAEFMLP